MNINFLMNRCIFPINTSEASGILILEFSFLKYLFGIFFINKFIIHFDVFEVIIKFSKNFLFLQRNFFSRISKFRLEFSKFLLKIFNKIWLMRIILEIKVFVLFLPKILNHIMKLLRVV